MKKIELLKVHFLIYVCVSFCLSGHPKDVKICT